MARPAGRGRSVLGAGDPLGLLPAGRCGGKAAETGLTQADRERVTDLAHGVDDLIDRNAARDTGNGHVRRADGIDYVNRIIYELKPNNPRAIARGWKQLNQYANLLGGEWTQTLVLY